MDLTTCIKQSKDVEFQDVYYTVTERKNYVKVTGTRSILRGVSGAFRNGELSAIMGPSGAGKSSLLNAISGFSTSGVTGHIKINRKDSCYITQDDCHQSLLTVQELMNLACDLKLKNRQGCHELVTEILENLHLNHRRNVTSDHLSGGERKRLSIALELVANPNIFFLDEPTSGLDEVTAAQCIRLLSRLAREGRTIVCTIHQPSATILNYFDNIFVLAKGQCVYQGTPSAIIPFLGHINLTCPMYYSPSDYIIELCDADEGHLIPTLAEVTQNGKLVYSTITQNSQPFEKSEQKTDMIYRNAVTTMFIEENTKRRMLPCCSLIDRDGAFALVEKMKAFSKRIRSDREKVSSFRQFYVLLNVMMLKILRARIALSIQIVHHIMCGLCFGIIFYKSANEGERMFDHLKFCIGTILTIVYTQVMVPILSYPSDVKMVKKETFNRWYSLPPYYMALTLSRIPVQTILNIVFLSLIYWMSGMPPQIWRFCLFSLVGIVTSLVAEGMGLWIGATFSITNGSAVGPMMIAPFMGLAIYGFDFASEIPTFMNIIMKFSYIRVGAVSMVISIFGFNREELACNDIYCHFGDPKVLLRFLQMDKLSIIHQFCYLLLLMVFFRTLLYISLRKRCKT